MGSNNFNQVFISHLNRKIPAISSSMETGDFMKVKDITDIIKRRFRPPALNSLTTYPIAATVTPVIILED